MDDLVAWLRGVLDEDETDAQYELDHPDGSQSAPGQPGLRRVLADIAAKRAILDAYESAVAFYSQPNRDPYLHPDRETIGLGQAVQHIAAAYRHLPGYRPEWSPQ